MQVIAKELNTDSAALSTFISLSKKIANFIRKIQELSTVHLVQA